MTLPACSCGAAAGRRPGGSHALSCAMIRAALGREPAAAPSGPARSTGASIVPVVAPAVGRLDGLGRARGVVTVVRGIRVRTRLEALVFEHLLSREEAVAAAGRTPGVVLRQPRFDLWRSWAPGMGTPLRFTPDFAVLRPGVLEVHEAKGPAAVESRDFVVRLAAFRAMLPWATVTIWRRDKAAGPDAIAPGELPPIGDVPTPG